MELATKTLPAKLKDSLGKCHHNLCDEYNEAWDMSGAVKDIQAFFEIGDELSKENIWPKWSKTSEFKR